MKKYINQTCSFNRKNLFKHTAALKILLPAFIFLLGNKTLLAQGINIDGAGINIPSGTYITTDGGITMQNLGTIDNSGTIKTGGNWTNNTIGLINNSPGTVEFNGTAGAQTIGGSLITTFSNLTVNNLSGLNLSGNQVIAGTLNFIGGKINTGVNTLVMTSASSITNAGPGKYVNGKLQILFNAALNQSRLFAIGDNTIYAPVSLTNFNVTGAGNLTAYTFPGANPSENNPMANASGISQTARANRYWKIDNGVGFTFSNADATFNFDASESTGNPLFYKVHKFDLPSTWSATTTGTVTATSTQATGLTSFSEFEVGEAPLPAINCNGALNVNNTPGSCSATITNAQLLAHITVSGSPTPAATFLPIAGTFPVGSTPVTVTVTNINGISNCAFNVNVVDNEDPTVTCPPPLVVNTNAGVCYATNINFGTPGFGDNCSGSTVGNNALAQYPSGQFPQGGIVVQWEVTDQSGNKASCDQTVAVVDAEPPVALCKNLCVYLNSAGVATITGADINDGSHDNCGINPGPNGLVASKTSFSYADAGANTVTLTVKDVNGNTSTCTSTVTVGEYFSLFGADNNCTTPPGGPPGCRVMIGNGNTITGNVGSYRLVETGGGVVINGKVLSGGKVNYANGVTSGSVSAANLLGQSGAILMTGSAAHILGDIDVTGNINVNANGSSTVTGTVRHPVGTTYSGPSAGGGVLIAPPVLPALPGMPAINAYGCGGANFTTSATLIPGSYGNITLGNAAGVVITFHGAGNYYFSSIKMGQGGIHTFKYDFLGLPGKINIYVCGDINFGQHESQWANPNVPDACRVYFETHGTGSTNGTNSTMSCIIELGSHFYGRVWAPYGGIKVGSGSCCTYATGSLWSAKQVQLDGAVTFNGCSSPCPPAPRISEEFTATDNLNGKLQVYPNPTSGKTIVAFFTEIPYSYTLKVMDNLGRVVLSNQSKAIAGDNTQEIDMSGWPKGLYLIEVGNQDHSQKVKLVVE